MRKQGTIAAFVVLTCCLPAVARADAGTALIWATMLHLVFGNALIGMVEAALLVKLFGTERSRSVGIMIGANYFSAWVGGMFLRHLALTLFPPDLYSAQRFFWLGVVATYLMTLVLEWPFVALCFGKGRRRFKPVLRANLTVQTITYVVLFGWYWGAQRTPLYDEAAVVPPSEISFPPGLRLYYISDADGDVYSRTLGGEGDERVFDLNSTGRYDCLFVIAAEDGNGDWDLMMEQISLPPVLVLHDAAEGIALRPGETLTDRRWEAWRPSSVMPRLAEAQTSDWRLYCGEWAAQGIWGENKSTGQRVQIAYETSFGLWYMRSAVHLPGDLVVFQLGDRQICVLDVNARKVALLARGRGPVVVVPKTDDKTPSP